MAVAPMQAQVSADQTWLDYLITGVYFAFVPDEKRLGINTNL